MDRLHHDLVAFDAMLARLLAIAAIGLAARAAVWAVARPANGLVRVEPSAIADNINAGRGFVYKQYGALYRAWKEPLYITLLAAMTRGHPRSDAVILLFQWTFGIGCALAAAVITQFLLRDAMRSTLAGALTSVNPFLVYYDTHFVHPLSLDVLLFLASTGAIAWAGSDGRLAGKRAVFAGVVTGVGLWQRGTLLATGAGSWVGLVAARALAGGSLPARAPAMWMVTSLLVISPWLARNYLVLGRLVFTTDFAHIVWLGNNPASLGTYSDESGRRVFYRADPSFRRRIWGAPELVQHDTFLAEARRFVRAQPRRAATLVGSRIVGFFWFTRTAGIQYRPWQIVLYACAYLLVLGLGMVGLFLLWQRGDPELRAGLATLAGGVVALAFVHAATALNLRHRVPLEVVLAIFASEPLARSTRSVVNASRPAESARQRARDPGSTTRTSRG